MPTPLHSDYAHTPTLEDVALTAAQRSFKAFLLRRESQTFSHLALLAMKRGWRFVARDYSFKAVRLQRHADFLAPL